MVKLWDVSTRQELATLKGTRTRFIQWHSRPTARRLLLQRDKTVKLWDVSTRQELAMLKGHTEYVSSLAFSPDKKRMCWQAGAGIRR